MISLPLFIAWSFIVFQQFSIVSLFFFIALKIHTCKLLKLQCSTIQHSSFPLEQLHPQRWFIKNMEKGNPFIFMETNIIMSVHFSSAHLYHWRGPEFLKERWGLAGSARPQWVCPVRDTGNGHQASPRWASKLSALPHCCGSMMKEIHLH